MKKTNENLKKAMWNMTKNFLKLKNKKCKSCIINEGESAKGNNICALCGHPFIFEK